MKDKKANQAYRWCLRYIEEHRFSNDTKLPSENTLKRMLGFSRETIRSAYDRLEMEGLVIRRKGSGTYIVKGEAISQQLNAALDETKSDLRICLILQGRATSPSDIMINGMKSIFSQYHADLHVYLTDNQFYNERMLLETVSFHNYQGFIVDGVKSSFISPNLDCYRELYRRNIPVIFYNNYYRDLPYPKVGIDNKRAAELLIHTLIHAGHRNIAGIFVYDNIQSIEKFHGMLSVLYRYRIKFTDDHIKWISSDDLSHRSNLRLIRYFLKRLPKATAIVCCNYRVCMAVMEVLEYEGLRIPDDFSVVCFDYTGDDYEKLGITCTVHRGYDLGVHIATQLMKMIENHSVSEQQYSYKMSPLLYTGNSVRSIPPSGPPA